MFYNIINSERRAGDSVAVTSPRTNEALWDVAVADETDLDDAVEAARVSFKSWKLLSVEARQKYLLKLADELEQRRSEIHVPLAAETGKSNLLANIEIDDTLAFIRFNASQSLPDKVEYENDKLKIVSTHHPIGVVGAICPWNFPLVLAAGKIAAALVMGNCILVKPSPFTPCATLKFAELATSVLPRGVLQALNGDNDMGRLMTIHPGIDKISFTGSIATGKKVAENGAKTLKRVTLELGGNDASIVCPDVDIENVAPKVAAGSFFHSGQMCVATKRIYVHEAIFQEFRDAFMEAVKNIKIDLSGDESPLFSPIQNKIQYNLVKDIISDCKERNYTLLCGGDTDEQPGLFIAPVVIDQPPHDSRIVQMEQFGPIIPLTKWSTEDEVISKANGTDTGLGACVWAKDTSTAERIARKLEVGTVWINSAEVPNPNGYISGWKQSGIGGEWGNQGLLSYSHTQTIQLYK
ncbi:Aldehyde dehydrogenase N-terminal [Penicillium coprophilum]|uniref:Aldehyde dehydrogenase N-terminal n=1 Tax=Penicillium coprophilum TaxID=36646 RepID=UPI00239406EE|nr:Aldehyde dehydrogenase N-terminal [Penicillium coprophilum]KAJ5165068.1 Aldehyde dehydrogenase N-terminal [Penicillium coprophilum]